MSKKNREPSTIPPTTPTAAGRRKPLPEETVAFWNHMTRRHGTRVIRKSSAAEMRLVARFLSVIGVLDAKRFMTRYTTIIGRRIYTPWEIGQSDDPEGLWKQIVTCTHEHQHAIQQRRDGALTFARRYLLSSTERARYEAEAYRCNMELHWQRFGEILDPKKLAKKLEDYGCSQRDIDLAERLLESSALTIRRGGISTQATHEAIMWLRLHAPGVLRDDDTSGERGQQA